MESNDGARCSIGWILYLQMLMLLLWMFTSSNLHIIDRILGVSVCVCVLFENFINLKILVEIQKRSIMFT